MEAKYTSLELNNGIVAEHIGFSDWGDKLYNISFNEKEFTVVYLEGEDKLYSFNCDYDEPGFPLKQEFQPKDVAWE